MRAIVFIPTYNEADNIIPLMEEVLKQDDNLEVLVGDDNSPDGTWKLVREEEKRNHRVHLLLRRKNRGRGLAGLEGFRRALEMGADRVIEMDADFSHDPRCIPALLRASDEADLVIGSRYVAGGKDAERGIARRFVSACARRYLSWLLGLGVKDPASGYRCFRGEALRLVMGEALTARDPFIVTEILYHCRRKGIKIVEVPITFHERRAGKSKLGALTLLRYLFSALKLRFKNNDLNRKDAKDAENKRRTAD